jgi:hypothetical protein
MTTSSAADFSGGGVSFPAVADALRAEGLKFETDWLKNHFKWIVFKCACLERFNPPLFATRKLTLANVLKECRFRQELLLTI